MDPSVWVPICCSLIAASAGLFGLLARHHLESVKADREALRVLQDKVMDRAIPALEHNAAATEEMIKVTRTLSDLVLILNDRNDRNDRPDEHRRQR